jgi:hypothetical protein
VSDLEFLVQALGLLVVHEDEEAVSLGKSSGNSW